MRKESIYRQFKQHHIIINMLQGNNSLSEDHMNGCRVVIAVGRMREESIYIQLKQHHIIINMLQGNNSLAENHMNGCRVVIEVRTNGGGVKIQTIETTSHYHKYATRQQLTN